MSASAEAPLPPAERDALAGEYVLGLIEGAVFAAAGLIVSGLVMMKMSAH